MLEYNKKQSREKGITLIALVISIVTVIVLIEAIVVIALKGKSSNNVDLSNANQSNQGGQEENTYKESNVTVQNEIDNSSNIDIDLELKDKIKKLNTENNYNKDGDFLMPIEDSFEIEGRGTVVTGQIKRGTIKLDDTVQIIGLNDEVKSAKVFGIEMLRTALDNATAGDNVGILLRNIKKDEIDVGQVIAKPNSISNVSKFEASIYVLSDIETSKPISISNNGKFNFKIRSANVLGTVTLSNEKETINPGEIADITVELESPVAIEDEIGFEIIDDGRSVVMGMVTRIY